LILNALAQLFRQIRLNLEMRGYDRFTIVDYLRKQGASIGDGCSIIPTSLGAEPYLVKIGNHVTIASGVKFITHDGGAWIFRHDVPDLQVFGPIVIGDNCAIGENVLLLPNIRIGANSIIGAGSVVISDIPENVIAIGIPARVFTSTTKYREKCLERWKAQKPADIQIEEGATWWNSMHNRENSAKLRRSLTRLFSLDNSAGGGKQSEP
jgi:acetyltransferase-like isoleucine patch superfamily enzyme